MHVLLPKPPATHRRAMVIPQHTLVTSEDFAERLPAEEVAQAIARGLRVRSLPEADLCPLPRQVLQGADLKSLLDSLDFDRRMRAARAVIVATPSLHERALSGSATFELATRARQAGVPAYAITAHNALDAFDVRILDLQVILEAGDSRALAAAGRKLARCLSFST